MTTTFRFLPWVKSGIASAVTTQDNLIDAVPSQASFPVAIKVNKKKKVSVDLHLYGPGHITGIDTKEIVRTDPPNYSTNFEPNYFPVVEFRRADFPWLFTPATGGAHERLRPWLVLVVVKVQEGVSIGSGGLRPLPVLNIQNSNVIANELPDLEESWAWAHAQTVIGKEIPIEESLSANSPLSVSRLICPIRLRAKTHYHACLVPAFEVGRKAGLGIAPDAEQTLAPAWKSSDETPDEISLPVYYKWEFSTGLGGDFESLVRKLKGQPLPEGVGLRKMNVDNLGFNLPNLGSLDLASALRPPGLKNSKPAGKVFKEKLRTVLNATSQPSPDNNEDPVVGPPIYGSFQSSHNSLDTETQPPKWMESLNLDPRHRVAAGLGTLVVQDQQDLLMNSAWEQLSDATLTVKTLQKTQLAHNVNLAMFNKHLSRMSETDLFQVSAPAHKRIVVDPSLMGKATDASRTFTMQRTIEESELPTSSTSATFRRILRTRGPIARRMEQKTEAGPQPVMRQRLMMRMASTTLFKRLDLSAKGLITFDQVNMQFKRLHKLHRTKIFQINRPNSNIITPQGKKFLNAALPVIDYFKRTRPAPAATGRPIWPGFAITKQVLMTRLDPKITATLIFQAKTMDADSNISVDEELDLTQGEPMLRHPVFPQPMHEPLKELSQDHILPGVDKIPANTVTLLETNPEFIEAFMTGLNHEMSRELLWREYPTNQRGTYFTNFWGRMENLGQAGSTSIRPIHKWSANKDLGQHLSKDNTEGRLILLIRGELLQRYPGAIIYAVSHAELNKKNRTQLYPVLQGQIDPDIVFLGFNLTESEARGEGRNSGYYFVIEQPPTEPRFGLDVVQTFGSDPGELKSWNDLTWGHVVESKDSFNTISHLKIKNDRLAALQQGIENTKWGLNSAHQARITLQRPVKIALHAKTLLPQSTELEK